MKALWYQFLIVCDEDVEAPFNDSSLLRVSSLLVAGAAPHSCRAALFPLEESGLWHSGTTEQCPVLSTERSIRVIANFKGALNSLSRSDLCYLLSLPDNRFGRMAPFLDLVQGMPIQVTQNVATAKGIANGTLGILEYVHFATGTHYQLVRDGATSTIVQLPSQPPDYALIRVPRPHAASIRSGLDPELFPVFYTTEAYTKASIKLAPAPDGQPRYVKVRPQQFPFVCAVGSTVYKVQGETLQSMIVIDWKSTQPLANKPQQTYLLVSRVTTRNGLTAVAPLTPKLVEWSKPPDHALREEERLNDLSNATLEEFHLPVTTNVTDRYRDGNNPQSRDEAP